MRCGQSVSSEVPDETVVRVRGVPGVHREKTGAMGERVMGELVGMMEECDSGEAGEEGS
jgi:hypothetical protein